MAQMPGTPGPQRLHGKAENDIYTVLLSIGMAAVMGTVGFVIYRCVQLFDTPFPGFSG